jgi:hypothetical protein
MRRRCLFFTPTSWDHVSVLTEARLQSLQDSGWRLYATIAQFYVVRVESKASHTPWKLELAKDLRSNTRAPFTPCSLIPAPRK